MKKLYRLNILSNVVAAIVLFGAGSQEMNNIQYTIPPILCIVAAVKTVLAMRGDKEE